MANPQPTPPPAAGSSMVRVIAIVLLALIFIAGLIVLIVWLVIKPKHLVYSIESGSISGFNLRDNHLNSTFNFIISAHNPNKKVSVSYDKLLASVSYDDQKVAFSTVAPFFQPRKNVTQLGVYLVARDVAFSEAMVRDLKRERTGGAVKLDVRMKARIRFKVGAWKSGHRKLKISCKSVLVPFPPSKNFQRKFCDVDT